MVGEYLGAEWTASTSSTGNHAAELFDRAWISLPCKRIPMFPRTFRGRKCSARPALSGQLLRCDPRESACRRYSQRKALVNELALLLLPGGLITFVEGDGLFKFEGATEEEAKDLAPGFTKWAECLTA